MQYVGIKVARIPDECRFVSVVRCFARECKGGPGFSVHFASDRPPCKLGVFITDGGDVVGNVWFSGKVLSSDDEFLAVSCEAVRNMTVSDVSSLHAGQENILNEITVAVLAVCEHKLGLHFSDEIGGCPTGCPLCDRGAMVTMKE